MASVVPYPANGGGPEQLRPGQQLLPGYAVKLMKTLKIDHGTDRSMHGVDMDPSVPLINHIVDCMACLRDVNKVYRAKGSLASRSIGARAMFGFTAELGNMLLDAITFNPPIEFAESAVHYNGVASHILATFPEIASQVTKDTGKMLLHHTALRASQLMALESLKIVINAYPGAASSQDLGGALPLHWITHNPCATFDMVSLLIAANPKATMIPDVDGYLPLHWAVNQDNPSAEVVGALLAANVTAACKPCNRGSLPLHWCVNRDNPSIPVVEALLQAHPDAVRTFNDDGWLPIHRCVDRSNINTDVLRLLIELYPQGLQCPNSDGQLPLHRALDHPNPSLEAVKLLIEAYPGSIQVSDDEGYLPIHLALDCAAPSVFVVRYLLDIYPDGAHRKSRDGLLPLHCICSGINPPLEIVQRLLDLFPESPEHAAIDIVPVDEYADPDTWKGEWVKKRWTPLSRAIGRKLDGVVALMKAALHARKSGMGAPLKVIDSATSKRLFPQSQAPLHGKTADDSPEGAGREDYGEENYDDGRGRESRRDRDRGRDSSRGHRRDRDRERNRERDDIDDVDREADRDVDRNRDDRRSGKDRDRNRHRSKDRRHKHRDRDRDREREDRDREDRDRNSIDRGGRESSDKPNPTVSIVKGNEPSTEPPAGTQQAYDSTGVQRPPGRRGPQDNPDRVVPLRDLDFSDDEGGGAN